MATRSFHKRLRYDVVGQAPATTPPLSALFLSEEEKHQQHQNAIEHLVVEKHQITSTPIHQTGSEDMELRFPSRVELAAPGGTAASYEVYFKCTSWGAQGDESRKYLLSPAFMKRLIGFDIDPIKHVVPFLDQITPEITNSLNKMLGGAVWTVTHDDEQINRLVDKLDDYLKALVADYEKNLPPAQKLNRVEDIPELNLMGQAYAQCRKLLDEERTLSDAQRQKILQSVYDNISHMKITGLADYFDTDMELMLKRNDEYGYKTSQMATRLIGLPSDYSVFLNTEEAGPNNSHYLSKTILQEQLQSLIKRVQIEGHQSPAGAESSVQTAVDRLKEILNMLGQDEHEGRLSLTQYLNQVAKDQWNGEHPNQKMHSDSKPDEMAGHWAVNEALAKIGRGFVLTPAPQAAIEIQYSVESNQSELVQLIDPHQGEVTVLFHVKLDKSKSLTSEDPDSFKARMVQAVAAANDPATTRVPLEEVKVITTGDVSEYVMAVHKRFAVKSLSDVDVAGRPENPNKVHVQVFVPSALGPEAQNLLVWDMTPFVPEKYVPQKKKKPLIEHSSVYVRGRVGANAADFTGREKASLFHPGPSAEQAGGIGEKETVTIPSLQALGRWAGIEWLEDYNNAKNFADIIKKGIDVYTIKPDIEKYLPLNPTAADVEKAWKDNIDAMMLSRFGQTPSDMNKMSGDVLGKIFSKIYKLGYYRWAAEQAVGTPAYHDLQLQKEKLDLEVPADILGAVFPTKSKAQLASGFVHGLLRNLKQTARAEHATLFTNAGLSNFEVAGSWGYSPTAKFPFTDALVKYDNAWQGLIDVTWDPYRLHTPDHEMTVRLNIFGGIILPRNVRTIGFDQQINDAYGAVVSASQEIVKSNYNTGWNEAEAAFLALQKIFEARKAGGDKHAVDGILICSKGIFFAQNKNFGQFDSTVDAADKLLKSYYGANSSTTSDSELAVGLHSIAGHNYSSSDPVATAIPYGDFSAEIFGHYKPGERWQLDYLGRFMLPPAVLLDLALLGMRNTSHYPTVMTDKERSDYLRSKLPQFDSYLLTVEAQARLTHEVMLLNRQLLIGTEVAGNISALRLNSISLSAEYHPNVLGRKAPQVIKVEYSLQNPYGGTLTPSLHIQVDQSFPTLLRGFSARLDYVRTPFTKGGVLSNLQVRASLDFPIWEGKNAPGDMPINYTEFPAQTRSTYSRELGVQFLGNNLSSFYEGGAASLDEKTKQEVWDTLTEMLAGRAGARIIRDAEDPAFAALVENLKANRPLSSMSRIEKVELDDGKMAYWFWLKDVDTIGILQSAQDTKTR